MKPNVYSIFRVLHILYFLLLDKYSNFIIVLSEMLYPVLKPLPSLTLKPLFSHFPSPLLAQPPTLSLFSNTFNLLLSYPISHFPSPSLSQSPTLPLLLNPLTLSTPCPVSPLNPLILSTPHLVSILLALLPHHHYSPTTLR